jgi:hypothetical protein
MVRKVAGSKNGQWGNGVWGGLHCSGSICGMFLIWGGKLYLWIDDYYDSIQGFYTTLWVPYESVLFVYLQREWNDVHTKIRQRGIKGIEDKGNEGNRYTLGTRTGLGLLSRADPSMSFMLVFFSWMPIWSRPCHSVHWSLFSLCGSQLGLFFFGLPPCPSAFHTRSVSI